MNDRCRNECEYYSRYTNTCDYTLLMYKSKKCSTNNCTAFKPKAEERRWMKYSQGEHCKKEHSENSETTNTEVNKMYVPEPDSKPKDTPFIYAHCGHEVYGGEFIFDWQDGETLCPDCLEDKFSELTLLQKAELFGVEYTRVRAGNNCTGGAL